MIGTPLNCKDHTFLQDLLELFEELRSFYGSIFSTKGDIFEGYSFDWFTIKKVILEVIFQVMQKLETYIVLDIPEKMVSEVADRVDAVTNMGIRVKWIYNVYGEIGAKKGHYILIR